MLLAMSQGSQGSLGSIHADSSRGAFARLAMYAAMSAERLGPADTNRLVAGSVNLVVHLAWVGGVRRVTSVREITGVADSGEVASNEVWAPGPDGRAVPTAPLTHALAERLRAFGFDPASLRGEQEWLR